MVWYEHDLRRATTSIEESAQASPETLKPLDPVDEIATAIPETDITGLVAEELSETDDAPTVPVVTALQIAKAEGDHEARVAPAASASDVYAIVSEAQPLMGYLVAPSKQTHLQEARSSQPDAAIVPPIAKPTPPTESEASLLGEGQRLFENGRLEAARSLFKDLADAGLVEAAIALGSTYDPKSLAANGMTDIIPDPEKALFWYRRAHLLARSAAASGRRRNHPD